MEILKIKNLKKTYHTKNGETLAVDNFSFNLKEGEFIAIVGPSGCGKSTILSILCGLDKASDGEIIIDKNLKFGYMLQGDNLFEWQTIFKNCLLGLEINNEVTKENKEYVKSLLKTYGLEEFMDAHPSNLSGGMRQRVALIRTLVLKPDLLLLDEPFSALDAQTKIEVQNDVYNIIKQEKKSALIVTHDISEAIALADKIIILSERPAKIIKTIEIAINNLEPNERRKDVRFINYYDLITKEIKKG